MCDGVDGTMGPLLHPCRLCVNLKTECSSGSNLGTSIFDSTTCYFTPKGSTHDRGQQSAPGWDLPGRHGGCRERYRRPRWVKYIGPLPTAVLSNRNSGRGGPTTRTTSGLSPNFGGPTRSKRCIMPVSPKRKACACTPWVRRPTRCSVRGPGASIGSMISAKNSNPWSPRFGPSTVAC